MAQKLCSIPCKFEEVPLTRYISCELLQYFGVDLKTYKSDSCGWTVVSDTPDSMVQGSILTDRLKFTQSVVKEGNQIPTYQRPNFALLKSQCCVRRRGHKKFQKRYLNQLVTYLPPYLPTSLPTYLPTYVPPYLPTYLPTNCYPNFECLKSMLCAQQMS